MLLKVQCHNQGGIIFFTSWQDFFHHHNILASSIHLLEGRGMLVGDKNFEITTRREYFTIHDMNTSAGWSDYEYHNYQYSRPLQITLFELGRKSCSSTIYFLLWKFLPVTGNFVLWQEISSGDRKLLPLREYFFL